MIGLDTNLIVRYLTRDDAAQYKKAKDLVDRATARDQGFLINAVVLCEVAWVLGSVYDYSRKEIADALDQILATEQFTVEHADDARNGGGVRARSRYLTMTSPWSVSSRICPWRSVTA